MGLFTGIYEIVKKLLGWIILPVFKFFRLILWDKTLRIFFNDVLKITFIVGLVDDYLDVVEALIEDPAELFVMTNTSIWVIFAPWIVNLLLLPINRMKLMAKQKLQTKSTVVPSAVPSAVPPTVSPAVPSAVPPTVSPAVPVPSTVPSAIQSVVQEGGSIMMTLGASPDMKTYIGVFSIICFIYFLEKKDLCNKKKTKKGENKWESWNLTKYSFWFGIFITAFYAAIYLVFPFIPIIGIFFRIITRLPVIGKIVPGLLTYLAYNMLRNITEIMKKRTHCTLQ